MTSAELMVLGFISLLLTFGQSYIARICISEHIANTMLPCKKPEVHDNKNASNEYQQEAANLLHEEAKGGGGGGGGGGGAGGHRRLLWNEHRMLSGGGGGKHKCHEVLTAYFLF